MIFLPFFFCQLESLCFSSLKTPGPLCYREINSLGKVFRKSTKQLLAHLCQILLTRSSFPFLSFPTHTHQFLLLLGTWLVSQRAWPAAILFLAQHRLGSRRASDGVIALHVATKGSADSASAADLKGSGEDWKIC